MSIPLDRLYHYIESVAQDVRGGNVLIYHFYPHGSKKVEDLRLLHLDYKDWINLRILPQIYCYDQEPLDFKRYENASIDLDVDDRRNLIMSHLKSVNLRRYPFNIFDQALLLHSEKNSEEVEKYYQNNFIPVYYWSHAVIARDWFRYAQHQSQCKNIKKTFLIYNRAWSGTREYRLKLMDLLIDANLIEHCHTFCNPIEPELQIHYSDYEYINPNWKPNNCLENYLQPTQANSWASADIDINDYNSTEFEVVLETIFDDRRIQLTEKMLRPIACGQPFLIAGTAGSLEYLREYGFRTFEGIVDESYDKITDANQRLIAIVKVMQTITNWTDKEKIEKMKKIKDIVNYNKQHFFGNEFFNFVIDELKTNLHQGLSELEEKNTGNRFFNLRKIVFAHDKIINNEFGYPIDNSERTRQDVFFVVKLAKQYQMRNQ